jgi:hypothetical protein
MTNLQILELAAFAFFFIRDFKGTFFPDSKAKERNIKRLEDLEGVTLFLYCITVMVIDILWLFLFGLWARRIITFF